MNASGFTTLQGWGITILRVVVGIVFLVHGGQKLFVWGFAGVAAFMAKIGIPAPVLAATVVTLVELLGGLALILGLFTRWVAVPLAINMAVAILVVHRPAGFFLPNGYEFALTLFAANLALALLGSGKAAMDTLLESRKS